MKCNVSIRHYSLGGIVQNLFVKHNLHIKEVSLKLEIFKYGKSTISAIFTYNNFS